MILVDLTLMWTMRSMAVMRSRGFSNQPFGSLRMPLFGVFLDFVAVDEPFEWGSAVDDIPVRFFWDTG